MTSLGSTFKATRAKAVEMECDGLSEMFHDNFGWREGDYIEGLDSKDVWRPCRILAIRNCYWNQGGGCTADIQLAILLRNGKIGTGRGITISTGGKGGKGIRVFSRIITQVRRGS